MFPRVAQSRDGVGFPQALQSKQHLGFALGYFLGRRAPVIDISICGGAQVLQMFEGSLSIWRQSLCSWRPSQVLEDSGAPLPNPGPSGGHFKSWGTPILVHLELVEDWGVDLCRIRDVIRYTL